MSDSSYQNISLSEYSWSIFYFPWQEEKRKYIIEKETSLKLRYPDSRMIFVDKEILFFSVTKEKYHWRLPDKETQYGNGDNRSARVGWVFIFEKQLRILKTTLDTWPLKNTLGFYLCSGTDEMCKLWQLFQVLYCLCFLIWTMELMTSIFQGYFEALTEHLIRSWTR